MGTWLGASWRTTVMGYVVATVLYVQEAMNSGTVLPKDTHGWVTLLIAGAIGVWGRVQKDAAVSNAPAPGNPQPVPKPVVP